ncbi:MAG: hypothetical protein P8Y23_12075, partial [Candidatus Lokiarchaeota archaeon]
MEQNSDQDSAEETFSFKLKKYFKNLLNFSQYSKKTIFYISIFIVLIIFSVILLYINYFVDSQFLYRLVITLFVNPVYEL